jgi:hypothetical protein
MADIHAARNKTFWQRDAYTRWLYKCATVVISNIDDVEVCQQQVIDFLKLSSAPVFKKYSTANIEDFLEEFPRLPPEANPLDARFLAPGAPVIQPIAQRLQFADERDGNVEDELVRRLMRAIDNGRQDEVQELIRGLPPAMHGVVRNIGREPGVLADHTNVLNPEMPLLQLFLQSLLPWNRFDPHARDQDGDE